MDTPFPPQEKTLFQRIADHEIPANIVYEDELCVAFHDVAPVAPTHILLIPRKPLRDIGDATAEDADVLAYLMLKVGDVARSAGLDAGYRVVINTGEEGGQTVPHLHLHILGGRPMLWPPG